MLRSFSTITKRRRAPPSWQLSNLLLDNAKVGLET